MSVYTSTYGPVYGGGFPLDIKVALQLGGTWTDVTQWAYNRTLPAFTITRGRPDETTQVTPSQMTGQLNNRDGRFTSRNPSGPYYGQLGRNTPVRLSVPAQYATLRIEGDTVSAAATAAFTAVTGDIDVRLEMDLSGWMPACLVSNWSNWALVLNGNGTLGWWIKQSSTVTIVSSTMPVPLGHGAVRVTRNHTTGVVTFYTSDTISGSWTQLGAAVTSVTGSLASTSESLTVGYDANVTAQNSAYGGPSGRFYDAQVMSGIAGTIKAEPAFTSQAAGTTTWTDAQGNSWAVSGTAAIDGRSYRYHGEMSSLPVAWDPSGHDIWVPFTAGGILRRLQQGTGTLQSPLRRANTVLTGTLAPVAYWPCEDGAGSTQLASGIPGGIPMTITGAPKCADDSSFICSLPIPVLNSSTWTGRVPAYASHGSIAVRFLLHAPSGGDVNSCVPVRILTSGTVGTWDVVYEAGSGLGLNAWSPDGLTLLGAIAVALTPMDGGLFLISVEVTPSGGNINYAIRGMLAGSSSVASATGTLSTASVGSVRTVIVDHYADYLSERLAGTSVGHITVQSAVAALSTMASPLAAWNGETAGERFARICAEEALAARIYGYPDVTQPMGIQTIDTLVNILQSCEDADQGMIYEPSECLGLGYRTLASTLSQAPAVTLDYSAAQVGDQENSPVSLTSVDDDQYTRNDWTLSRSAGTVSGSSYQAQLDDGSAMSVAEPPDGVGDYGTSKSVNVEADGQLPDLAQWLVRIGTVPEERYPQIVTGLHRFPIIAAGLGYAIQAVRIGDYVTIKNPPAWLPPGSIKQLVAGVTETMTSYLFQVSWNSVPESPHEVAVADDLVHGRADTDGATVHANISSGATSVSADTTASGSPLWSTAGGDVPFDIGIGGEQITVTAVSGSSSPQTLTITRSVNGVAKAHTAGDSVSLFYPPVAALI